MLDAGMGGAEDDSYDEPVDLAKVSVTANKVGVYHRVRFGGGRALSKKPMVDVGSSVRAGQAVGFIEQMGAITAIEVRFVVPKLMAVRALDVRRARSNRTAF